MSRGPANVAEPSTRGGACEPCRGHHGRADHGNCWANSLNTPEGPSDTGGCTCYDDAWEWHEQLVASVWADPLRRTP